MSITKRMPSGTLELKIITPTEHGIVESVNGWALNGIHNNKSEEENKNGEQKERRVANKKVSFLPDSGESEQQKANRNGGKGPAIKARRL